MKWFVCECWTLSHSPLNKIHRHWLRYHTSWTSVELEWRLKMFPSTSNLCFEIHHIKVHSLVLVFWNLHSTWSRSVNFPLRMFCMQYKHVFFHQSTLPPALNLNSSSGFWSPWPSLPLSLWVLLRIPLHYLLLETKAGPRTWGCLSRKKERSHLHPQHLQLMTHLCIPSSIPPLGLDLSWWTRWLVVVCGL